MIKIIIIYVLIALNVLFILLYVKNVIILANESKSITEWVKRKYWNDLSFYESGTIHSLEHLEFMDSLKSPTLLYVYSSNQCDKCVFSDISILKQTCKDYPDMNTLILSVNSNSRDDQIKMKATTQGLLYKQISTNDLKMPSIDNKEFSFFIIVKDGFFYLPFIPETISANHTFNYLTTIYDIFFDNHGIMN